jgi:pilus assembly protein CpaC
MPHTEDSNGRGTMHMKRIVITLIAFITSIIFTVSIDPVKRIHAAPAATQIADTETTQIGAGTESQGTLRVFAGRSMILQSRNPLKRVSITKADIAQTVVISPTQLMIHGLKPGTVTLLLWDAQERLRSFDLQVQIDTRSVSEQLKQLFPNENIEVSQLGEALVLSGDVTSQEIMDKAVNLAATQAPSVVNTMFIRELPKDTIMVKVRFAEVDRSAIQEMGVNFLSTGAGNTIGSTTTQMYGDVDLNVNNDTATFNLQNLLNVFIFRPDVNMGMILRALQNKNLLQILAEPNLLAADGQEASFLAGGEIPVPVVQSSQTNAVTIQWREFGIRLNFTANTLHDGRIRLKVSPEVSSLDYANAVTVSGFTIPALTSRKAETQVELSDGQSFAIAGLLDKRMRDTYSKIPGLGDIPVLGKLFQSKAANKNQTELMVLVTPSVVEPIDPGQTPPLPEFPEPFLDKKNFDKARSGAGESSNAR